MSERTNPALDYPLDRVPDIDELIEVAPGVMWLRLTIPFELNHINLWLLEDGTGYTLVDTGISSDVCRSAWQRLFNSVLSDKPIKRIISTHFHPDHFGLARWLQEETGADYYSSAETAERAHFLLDVANKDGVEGRHEFYEQHAIREKGVFEEFLKGSLYADIVSGQPSSITHLEDNDIITIGGYDWQVIMTYGHAPGHITLFCEALQLLISGDQILPTITSNVSVHADEPEANPLQEFLQSMKKFKHLPEKTLVLPSHGGVFKGLHIRIAEIVAHHDSKLGLVRELCETAKSIDDLMPELFRRKLEGINLVLGFGEALAHVNYLLEKRLIEKVTESKMLVYRSV